MVCACVAASRCLSYRLPQSAHSTYINSVKVALCEFYKRFDVVMMQTSIEFKWIVLIVLSTAEAGLLRVPKIYNTVITSDANLEPSRAFPIVQPVLTVGVQPVVAAAAIPAEDHAAYYPLTVGGFYPFLSGTNSLYPSPLLLQPAYGPAPVQRSPIIPTTPATTPTSRTESISQTENVPEPMPVQGDVLNNNNRLKNPEIPDVPPPPLPVSASKKT